MKACKRNIEAVRARSGPPIEGRPHGLRACLKRFAGWTKDEELVLSGAKERRTNCGVYPLRRSSFAVRQGKALLFRQLLIERAAKATA